MMLNELLWALVQQVNGYQCDEAVAEVETLYPDSVKLYNQHFQETVSHLKEIHEFINQVEGKNLPEGASNSSGLYKRAFCGGIKQVLRGYNELFLEIEDLALNDEHFSIVTMATKLYPLESAVRAIKEAVVEIKEKDIGCQILDVCNNYCHCGIEPVETAFKTIFKICLNPFFMQTNTWLLEAELEDPFDEYFIRAVVSAGVMNDDDESMSVTSSTSSLDELDSSNAVNYEVVVTKLPFFLQYSVAQKVLFVGQSLIMCQKEPSGDALESSQIEEVLNQCGLGPYDILNKIKTFEDGESLNVDSFDAFITDIYNGVNKYVRKLADMADVRGQLVLMRDLYLLGRGELFHEFIVKVGGLLDQEAHKTKIRLLKNAFNDAFYYVYLTDVSDILDAVNFTLPKSFDDEDARKTALDVLSLDVKITWPLETIFPPNVVVTFKRMFRFLMKLKKAQISLSESWTNTNVKELNPATKGMIFTRNKLNAFVVNLQNYCFTDVIELEMNQMLATVDASNTYTDIITAVGMFTKSVSEHLFLNFGDESEHFPCDVTQVHSDSLDCGQGRLKADASKKRGETRAQEETRRVNADIHETLENIFKVCGEFRNLTKDFSGDLPSAKLENSLKSLENKSDSAFQKLFQLSTTHRHNSHLLTLLLGLDYNDFFRKTYLLRS